MAFFRRVARWRPSRIGPLRQGVVLAALLGAFLGAPHSAVAISGSRGLNADDGELVVEVDTLWHDHGGFRPVHVTISRHRRSQRTEGYVLELIARSSDRGNQHPVEVSQVVSLPANEPSVEVWLEIPAIARSQQFSLDVAVDGVVRPRLRLDDELLSKEPWAEHLPAVLHIGSQVDLGEVDLLYALYDGSLYGWSVRHQSTIGADRQEAANQSWLWLQASKLPDRWTSYSGVDLVCITLPELIALAETRPAVWQAIRRWTAAGGKLLVLGVNPRREAWADSSLSELDKLLGFEPLAAADASAGAPPNGWVAPDPLVIYSAAANQELNPDDFTLKDWETIEDLQRAPKLPRPNLAPPGACDIRFLSRSLLAGEVVAIDQAELAALSSPDWYWVLFPHGEDRGHPTYWSQRHGFSIQDTNVEFANFLVPGTGQPPVTGFRVLITLFVLLIGPANYLLLRKFERLHLMVLTVPLGSLAVTGMLLTYAMLADGFSLRARSRSVTWIDQPLGQQTSWGRLSYYAGLSGGTELSFDRETAVIPIFQAPVWHRTASEPLRSVRQDDERNHLTTGWLPARTPVQLLTIDQRDLRQSLEVTTSGSSSLKVVNRLGMPLARLLVADEQGQLYAAENLPAGAEATLQPANITHGRVTWSDSDPTGLSDPWQEWFDEAQPIAPTGMLTGSIGQYSLYNNLPNDFREYSLFAFPNRDMASNLMEQAFHDARGATTQNMAPPPGHYVGIAEENPSLTLGNDRLAAEAQSHLVIGRFSDKVPPKPFNRTDTNLFISPLGDIDVFGP